MPKTQSVSGGCAGVSLRRLALYTPKRAWGVRLAGVPESTEPDRVSLCTVPVRLVCAANRYSELSEVRTRWMVSLYQWALCFGVRTWVS
jgi:hypothetical protein